MLNINFDLFYELKQGSVVSNTNENVVKYWRVVNGNFNIEKRFERFNNG